MHKGTSELACCQVGGRLKMHCCSFSAFDFGIRNSGRSGKIAFLLRTYTILLSPLERDISFFYQLSFLYKETHKFFMAVNSQVKVMFSISWLVLLVFRSPYILETWTIRSLGTLRTCTSILTLSAVISIIITMLEPVFTSFGKVEVFKTSVRCGG